MIVYDMDPTGGGLCPAPHSPISSPEYVVCRLASIICRPTFWGAELHLQDGDGQRYEPESQQKQDSYLGFGQGMRLSQKRRSDGSP